MKGISYITDEYNRKKAVVIDLKKNAAIWEDFCDYLIASSRKGEEKIPLEKVIKNLRKSGKLKHAI
ncbi:MAG: hypothetical protein K2U26_20580 [Cyclobacteriaceae bacterium]|nr:hypothetical protein [Cyclobacteriaceae bacterium]